jgi:tetratricopeptide (TPR) repeat protein
LGSAAESHYYFTELIDRESPAWKAKGHLGRGQAFAAEGKPEAAEEQLRQALALESNSEAAAHLALSLLKQDKKVEAETWARKARSMDKNSALATLALSDILLESGREEAALTLAETELEANPRSCDHLIAAAKANFKAALDDRAKEISEAALKICPGDPGPHFYLGAISARLGAKQEAKGHFEAYLEDGGDAQNLPRGYR